MARTRLSACSVALLALAACAAPEPAPTPQAQQAAGDQAIASLIAPEARVGPRRGWRRVRVDNPDVAAGFVDLGTITREGDARRAWIVMNFRESLPIPETGGRAFSVALVADYRCEAREWRPLENLWYRARNAEGLEWRQPSRQPVFRAVQPDTAIEFFLTAACAPRLAGATSPRGSRR